MKTIDLASLFNYGYVADEMNKVFKGELEVGWSSSGQLKDGTHWTAQDVKDALKGNYSGVDFKPVLFQNGSWWNPGQTYIYGATIRDDTENTHDWSNFKKLMVDHAVIGDYDKTSNAAIYHSSDFIPQVALTIDQDSDQFKDVKTWEWLWNDHNNGPQMYIWTSKLKDGQGNPISGTVDPSVVRDSGLKPLVNPDVVSQTNINYGSNGEVNSGTLFNFAPGSKTNLVSFGFERTDTSKNTTSNTNINYVKVGSAVTFSYETSSKLSEILSNKATTQYQLTSEYNHTWSDTVSDEEFNSNKYNINLTEDFGTIQKSSDGKYYWAGNPNNPTGGGTDQAAELVPGNQYLAVLSITRGVVQAQLQSSSIIEGSVYQPNIISQFYSVNSSTDGRTVLDPGRKSAVEVFNLASQYYANSADLYSNDFVDVIDANGKVIRDKQIHVDGDTLVATAVGINTTSLGYNNAIKVYQAPVSIEKSANVVDLEASALQATENMGLYYKSTGADELILGSKGEDYVFAGPSAHVKFGNGDYIVLGAGINVLEEVEADSSDKALATIHCSDDVTATNHITIKNHTSVNAGLGQSEIHVNGSNNYISLSHSGVSNVAKNNIVHLVDGSQNNAILGFSINNDSLITDSATARHIDYNSATNIAKISTANSDVYLSLDFNTTGIDPTSKTSVFQTYLATHHQNMSQDDLMNALMMFEDGNVGSSYFASHLLLNSDHLANTSGLMTNSEVISSLVHESDPVAAFKALALDWLGFYQDALLDLNPGASQLLESELLLESIGRKTSELESDPEFQQAVNELLAISDNLQQSGNATESAFLDAVEGLDPAVLATISAGLSEILAASVSAISEVRDSIVPDYPATYVKLSTDVASVYSAVDSPDYTTYVGSPDHSSVIYSKPHDAYLISTHGAYVNIQDLDSTSSVSADRIGFDNLVNLKQAVFSDGTLLFDPRSDNNLYAYAMYELFGRVADGDGFSYWADELNSGQMSKSQIASSFLSSAEASGLGLSQLTDLQFVEYLYNNLLDRSSDASGLAYWSNSLASGTSRADVLVGLIASNENLLDVHSNTTQGFWTLP